MIKHYNDFKASVTQEDLANIDRHRRLIVQLTNKDGVKQNARELFQATNTSREAIAKL